MLALQNGEWRGIANGAIAEPEQAFGYVSRRPAMTLRANKSLHRYNARFDSTCELQSVLFVCWVTRTSRTISIR